LSASRESQESRDQVAGGEGSDERSSKKTRKAEEREEDDKEEEEKGHLQDNQQRKRRESDEDDGSGSGGEGIATVEGPPSLAAAAGMLGSDPGDDSAADALSLEICAGATSTAPAQCLASAPAKLSTSLRAALCVDAEGDAPSQCAHAALNVSAAGIPLGIHFFIYQF